MRTLPNDFFFEEIKEIISQGESVEILVRGNSMSPYLRDKKDKVVIAPLKDTTPQKGDIILFFHSGQYLLHRVIKKKENYFIVQGDGIVKKQENVLLTDIIGIVRYIIHPSGKCVSVNCRSHLIYWRFWLLIRPFRSFFLSIYMKLNKII